MARGTDSGNEHGIQLRRAVIASTIGTTIEWYDFFLYSTVTGLVFAKLFFPKSDPLVGTLQAFLVYAAGFAARPIGAFIFGHYGDRIGRKSTLIATLILMGASTFAVGLVPGYASIGVWGAIILTMLRFIQGIGVGGEWGGSVLLAMEWAKTHSHRGFIASWPQFGVPAGLFLANLAVLGAATLSGDAFLEWGWRVPFLLNIVLMFIGLYIRVKILETPTFRQLVAERKIEARPVVELFRRQSREVFLTATSRLGQQTAFYIFTAYVFAYGTTTLGMSKQFLLTAVMSAAVLSLFTIPFFGWLSDRIGRKRMYLIGTFAIGAFGFVYFWMLDQAMPGWVFLAIVVAMIPHDMAYGPQAALIAESFTPRLRYSGASAGYHLASLVAGGPAPLIAVALFATFGTGYAIATYIAVSAALSFIATLYLPDRTGQDVSG